MLRLRALTRRFRDRVVFESGELETASTGLVALRGPNGSGKTTLLRILATLTEPSSGDAWVDGHSIVARPRLARGALGFVPAGDGGMFGRLTGRENLMLFAGLSGLSAREARRAIDRCRELVPIEGALECRFGTASSGMRQALVLCRAILHDPANLLLDEPSRSLDETAKERFWSVLRELARDRVLLFSTHDPAESRQARQAWEIQEGRLACLPSC